MLSKISVKKNIEAPHKIGEIIVNGQNLTNYAKGFQLTAALGQAPEMIVHLLAEVPELEIEGVTYLVAPPSNVDLLNQAAGIVRGLVPGEIEAAALEKMQFNGDQRLTPNILEVIAEVLEYAAAELETSQEVRRSEHGGDHSDVEASDISGSTLE